MLAEALVRERENLKLEQCRLREALSAVKRDLSGLTDERIAEKFGVPRSTLRCVLGL